MKRRRHTPEQIIRKPRGADRMLAEGKATAEVAKALEVSENTFPPLAQAIRRHEGRRRAAAQRRGRVHPRGGGRRGRALDHRRPDRRTLDRLARERGAFPEFVRMDNGPELTAHALRDRCLISGTGLGLAAAWRPEAGLGEAA